MSSLLPAKRIALRLLGIITLYGVLLAILVWAESQHAGGSITNTRTGLWWALVTLTTVGYGDYYPVSMIGHVVGSVFVATSVAIYGLIIGQFSSILTHIREQAHLGYKGTMFTNHTIIAGWNEAARDITEQLVGADRKVAIITDDRDEIDVLAELYPEDHVFTLLADFENFELIKKTNITAAHAVFLNRGSDTTNLVYGLNLRKHYGDLNLVANLENPDLRQTFVTAGIRHVVSNNEITAKLVASYMFEPDVAAFTENILSYIEHDDDHDLKQYRVSASAPFRDVRFGDAFMEIKRKLNCIVVGLARTTPEGRQVIKTPPDDLIIYEGDYLIVLVNGKNLRGLQSMLGVSEGYTG